MFLTRFRYVNSCTVLSNKPGFRNYLIAILEENLCPKQIMISGRSPKINLKILGRNLMQVRMNFVAPISKVIN